MGMKLKDLPLHPDNDFTEEELELRDAFCDFMQPVADWLEAGAPHVVTSDLQQNPADADRAKTGFDMSSVYYTDKNAADYNGEECGAVMCMLGAAAQFSQHFEVKALVGNIRTQPFYRTLRPLRRFGPWNERAEELFFENTREDTTPGRALEALIDTVTKGYPCWD